VVACAAGFFGCLGWVIPHTAEAQTCQTYGCSPRFGCGPFSRGDSGGCPGGVCPSPYSQPPRVDAGFGSPRVETAPKEKEVPEAVAAARRAVVQIDHRGNGGGSGVYLGNRLVLSCAHLFPPKRQGRRLGRIVVSFPDGEATTAELLDQDDVWDLAILRLAHPPRQSHQATWAAATPKVGETVVSMGYGGRGAVWCNVARVRGYAFAKVRQTGAVDTVLLSGRARPGDSGGPIFNAHGRLVGILWGTGREGVVGTQIGRCQLFCRPWFRRKRCDPPRFSPHRKPAAPNLPPIARQNNLAELKALQSEVAELRQLVTTLQSRPGLVGPAGPMGPRGLPGKDGRDGKDGRNAPDSVSRKLSDAEVDRLAEAVRRRLTGSVRIQVERVPVKPTRNSK